MNKTFKRLNSYVNKLVPEYGKAGTVAGEIVRALNKIAYHYYNDGDQIGVGYGNETCNAPARYLIEKLPAKQGCIVFELWHDYRDRDDKYEKALKNMINKVLDWLDTTELKSKTNNEDMLDWTNPDDYMWDCLEEDEDEYYEYEDEYYEYEYEDEYEDDEEYEPVFM